MLTNRKLLFLCPDDKFQLWSQQLHFWESQSTFFKNGQKKCPKSKTQNTFWNKKTNKINKLYYLFKKVLKEKS